MGAKRALKPDVHTFIGGARLLNEGIRGREELGDVLRVDVRQLQAQVLEPSRQLHVLWVVVYGDHPADECPGPALMTAASVQCSRHW